MVRRYKVKKIIKNLEKINAREGEKRSGNSSENRTLEQASTIDEMMKERC